MSGGPSVDISLIFDLNEDDIEPCLESLFAHAPADVDLGVTVVSNRGDRPLADRIERRFPRCTVVRNPAPRGFAENHNVVLTRSAADYIVVANDDLVFLPGSLADALAFMERPESRDVAVLAPRLLNPDGSLQPSTYRFPTVRRALLSVTGLRQRIPFTAGLNRLAALLGRGSGRSRFWAHDRLVDVDTFRGAYMVVRGEAAREIGPMDEASRIGVEEVEWHYRMRQAGWRVVFNPNVRIIHRGSRTIRLSPGLRNEYLKGFLNFFRKHRAAPAYYGFAFTAGAALFLRWGLLRLAGRAEDAGIAREGVRICLRALRGRRPGP